MKTFTNAWITSYRMQRERKRTCLFGCRHSRDDMRHYISCPLLMKHLMEYQIFKNYLSPPVNTLMMAPNSVIGIVFITTAYSMYHAAVHDNRLEKDPLPEHIRELTATHAAHAVQTYTDHSVSSTSNLFDIVRS